MPSEKPIDFSALDGLDIPPDPSVFTYLTYLIILFGFSSLFGVSFGVSFGNAILTGSIFVVGILGLIWFNLYTSTKRTKSIEQLKAFVLANSFEYQISLIPDEQQTSGTLFTQGESKVAKDVVSGKIGNLPFCFFRYNYVVGSGKSRTYYDAQVMEITLPRKLPHMVIDSLVEEGNNAQSVLPINFDNSQKLELEGDFYKYFTLYAPDKYAISALTVIAPDAMETLMRFGTACDIEIIDNKLYFYWPKVAGSGAEYKTMFETVQEILKEIGKKLCKDDIFALKNQEKVHTTTNSRGVRLKYNLFNSRTLTAIALMAIYFYLQHSPSKLGANNGIISFVLFIIMFCLFGDIWGRIKKQRLRANISKYYGKI